MVDQTELPLDGVRVLELSTGVAGGYCGKLLVDAGAEVLKAEPAGGDALRRYAAPGAPPVEGDGTNGDHGLLFGYLAALGADPRRIIPHPQLNHRGFVEWMDHPICGRLGYPGFPFVFSGLGGQLLPRPAPGLGQHNQEILRDTLGLDDEAIAALSDDNVIGDWPIGWEK